MAVIVPFSQDKRRRARPMRSGERRGEIVIFHGVRVDRSVPEIRGVADAGERRPTPGIGR